MAVVGGDQVASLLGRIKSKVVASLKRKSRKTTKAAEYSKMEKSSSFRMEMKSAKARRLIERTLRDADQPGKLSISS